MNNLIVHLENSGESTRKILEVMFSNVPTWIINILKNINAPICYVEKKKKKISFIEGTEIKKKNLEINFTRIDTYVKKMVFTKARRLNKGYIIVLMGRQIGS